MANQREKSKLRRERIFKFCNEFLAENSYIPTIREICSALNIKSTSTVHADLAKLQKEGLIDRPAAKPRAMRLNTDLTDEVKGPNTPAETRRDSRTLHFGDSLTFDDDKTIDLPVVGTVAAGQPITAEENITDTFPMPSRYVQGECFMLKVKGDSMVNVGIFDGDLIMVQKQQTARNGEIVVAMVDGFGSEATVKTYYKEDNYIRLQPENDTMSPILVKEASIIGSVKGVFRYYS